MPPETVEIAELRKLRAVWENLASEDPLWAICSIADKKGRKWKLDEFFQTGRDEIRELLAILSSSEIDFKSEAALDFGCGIGRLSQALAEHFNTVCGVDISGEMISVAGKLNRYPDKCRYFPNLHPDLQLFADNTFTFIYSTMVLQHIPPTLTRIYLKEFLRVLREGGLLVFQLPSGTKTERGLPAQAWVAEITTESKMLRIKPREMRTISIQVTNRSPVTWYNKNQAVIALGNHWLDETGSLVRRDDGRCPLPIVLQPANTAALSLEVTAPPVPGRCLLELDIVQEGVAWFGSKGSPTLLLPVEVGDIPPEPQSARATNEPPTVAARNVAPCPTSSRAFEGFSMHCIPRSEVLHVLREAGGQLEYIEPSPLSGPGFQAYMYFVRKTNNTAP